MCLDYSLVIESCEHRATSHSLHGNNAITLTGLLGADCIKSPLYILDEIISVLNAD